MEKEIKNMEDAQQLKDELEKFKAQQRELLKKLQEQQGSIEPQFQPLNEENAQSTVQQVSPSTMILNGDNLLDINEQQIEQEAKKQVNNIKENETFAQPSQQKQSKLQDITTSKAQLALLTLEEEILTDSVEIFLPGLKENVVVKPLKNIEELNLKTQNLSFATFLRQLNILLLNKTHIQNIPLVQYFKSIEEFENKILPVDRILLIFGLVKNSFENLTEFPMTCENCGKEFISSPSVENLYFSFNIDKETILNTDYYALAVTKSYLNGKLEIDFGFNPEIVRMNLLKMKSNNEIKENLREENNVLDAIDNMILFIKKIRVYKPDRRTKEGRKLITEIDYYQDGFQEIFDFIHNMPMKLKDLISIKTNLEDLEKYSPVFKITEACPYCGHIHELDASPEIEFFRKALSLLA